MKRNSFRNTLAKKIALALSLGLFSLTPAALALPTGGVSDTATIATSGNTMSITGSTVNNVINWDTFSVGSNEKVLFTNANNYLNIVTGPGISNIYGTLSGGGHVYLINPHGILIGAGATIDNMGAFIASTRNPQHIDLDAFRNDGTAVDSVLLPYNADNLPTNTAYSAPMYTGTLSVAEVNLTNVNNATDVIVEGSFVALKNTDALKNITQVRTGLSDVPYDPDQNYRAQSLYIGTDITTDSSTVTLTDAQQAKLFDLNTGATRTDAVSAAKLITSREELGAISDGDTNYYMLANDINMGTTNFAPIGYGTDYGFRGTFNGMGYSIKNLTISHDALSGNHPVGLFSIFNPSEVMYVNSLRNLRLEDVNIDGTYDFSYNDQSMVYAVATGALVGSSSYNKMLYSTTGLNLPTIDNVSVSGTVKGMDYTGGIVGRGDGFITNTQNVATVTMSGNVYGGGVIGYHDGQPGSQIINARNDGNVSAANSNSVWTNGSQNKYSRSIGGVVGGAYKTYPTVYNILYAYNNGNVTGNLAGGIIGGEIDTLTTGSSIPTVNTVQYGYNTGTITNWAFTANEFSSYTNTVSTSASTSSAASTLSGVIIYPNVSPGLSQASNTEALDATAATHYVGSFDITIDSTNKGNTISYASSDNSNADNSNNSTNNGTDSGNTNSNTDSNNNANSGSNTDTANSDNSNNNSNASNDNNNSNTNNGNTDSCLPDFSNPIIALMEEVGMDNGVALSLNGNLVSVTRPEGERGGEGGLNPAGSGAFGEAPADLPGGAENIVENSDNGASPGDEGENEEE
ncbi:MAG: filamentous hemagglutinin N-terminal domain-containing protein [Selenomonadaceae bacterium]|nr:filamentous hemagglutinin N-terminal domain-containing protein [Selenomonadaceae bacterium]